jgi:hypothetical protein
MRIVPACFLALIVQVPLFGSVHERDLFLPGDGLLTYDEVNNREWLDLTETAARDLNDIHASVEPGGVLEGFHFATAQDVEPLAISAGVQASPQASLWSVVSGTEAHKLIRLLGVIVHAEGDLFGELNLALGQVVQGFEADTGTPVLNDANFVVVSVGSEPLPGSINSPRLARPGGAYYFSTPLAFPDAPPLGRGASGPFWLYRQAVPEPRLSGVWLVIVGVRRSVRQVSEQRGGRLC